MKRAIWAHTARVNLAAIDDYYRSIAPDYARRVGRLAIKAGRFLAKTPMAGPSIDGWQTRKRRIAGTPYLLIYRLVPDGIEVLRVRHAAEDWRPS